MQLAKGRTIGGVAAIGLVLAGLLYFLWPSSRSEPSTLDVSPSQGQSYIASVIEALSVDEREKLQKQLDFIKTAADDSLKEPLERSDIPRLAQIAQEGVTARETLGAAWAKMKADPTSASGSRENARRELDGQSSFGDIARIVINLKQPITFPADKAIMVQAYLVAGSTIDRAINASPIVKEALARVAKLPPNDRTSDAARGIAQDIADNEPCFGIKSEPTPAQPNSIRGVSVGMTLDQALANLCVSEKNAIRYVGNDKQKSFQDFYGSRYRTDFAGGGEFWREFDQNDRRNSENMRAQEVQSETYAIRQRLGKDYTYAVSICLNCKVKNAGSSEKEPNVLKLTFLPDGRIANVTRIERFVDFVDIPAGDGTTRREEKVFPQTLKNLDAALRKEFGEPSFLTSRSPNGNTIEIIFGWVLPDGKKALPLETWYMPPSGKIELNGDGLIYDAAGISRDKLIKLNPRATFCITNAFELPVHPSGLDTFFKYDSSKADMEAMFGKTPSSQGAAKYAAAGTTENCGIVIFAKLTVDASVPESANVGYLSASPFGGEGGDIRKMLKRAVPITAYSVSVSNIDMVRDAFRAERAIVGKAYAEVQRAVGKAAKARSGAFVP